MNELEKVNQDLALSLLHLDEIDVNDDKGDELVSELQGLLSQRQKLLELLVADNEFDDRAYLEEQLQLTLKYKIQASKVMRHRQDLLHNGKKSQRQINVYKTIDSNR